jgi:hypothetical protein
MDPILDTNGGLYGSTPDNKLTYISVLFLKKCIELSTCKMRSVNISIPVSNEFAIDNPTNEFEIDMYSLVSLVDIPKIFILTSSKRIYISTFMTSRIIIVLIEKIKMIFFQKPSLMNHCLKSEQFFNISEFILIHFDFIILELLSLLFLEFIIPRIIFLSDKINSYTNK